MNRARVWAPFAIALISGLVVSALYVPVGDAMGWYNPFFGYMAVGIYAGLPIGLVAALISRTWRGALTLCCGLLVLGAIYGAIASIGAVGSVGGYMMWVFVERGVLAVPTYLVVTAVITALSSSSPGPAPADARRRRAELP
jgi:hypothetical protein